MSLFICNRTNVDGGRDIMALKQITKKLIKFNINTCHLKKKHQFHCLAGRLFPQFFFFSLNYVEIGTLWGHNICAGTGLIILFILEVKILLCHSGKFI